MGVEECENMAPFSLCSLFWFVLLLRVISLFVYLIQLAETVQFWMDSLTVSCGRDGSNPHPCIGHFLSLFSQRSNFHSSFLG